LYGANLMIRLTGKPGKLVALRKRVQPA